MPVKFRSVHTGKFHLSVHCKTAGTAHTRTVNHNRVHADHCGQIIFLRCQTDKFHHDHRTYGNTYIISLALFSKQIVNHLRYHAASSIRTVIRCYVKIASHRLHFFFHNQKFFRLGTDNHIRLHAVLMQPFHLRIHRRCSHSACHKQYFLLFQNFFLFPNQFGSTAKRPYKIPKSITGSKSCHSLRLSAHSLKYNGDGSCFPVVITYG